MLDLFGFALRVAGMYFLAMIMIRFLGKRALGELGPFDFVVMTGVGDTVISVALDKSMPLSEGMIVLATLAFLEYSIGYLSLKSGKLSNLLTGKPVVLIDNGKIIRKNLAREKFNVDDLLQELRKKGIREINEVESGILESCGGFSVVLKEGEETVKRKDLGIEIKEAKSLLTIHPLTRKEIFAQLEQEIEEEPVYGLMESLTNIELKLEQLGDRMTIMEQYLKS
ncbi:MAG TPA: YetF domain-containing protein [Syntrophomonas sp.]|nr:YetF domain-containing protein [Syntrophomonas sp.]